MIGRIHSIETMGIHDGPGIRTVIFMQGCPLKCQYCHNPDTLDFKGGKAYSVEDLVRFVKRYKPYYGQEGGVTFSGGEALMQGDFLVAAMKAMKAEGIHIALDTSGIGQSVYFQEILELTDLVLLDVKHFDDQAYKALTSVSMKRTYAFLEALEAYKGRIWIRHVMVPGRTDSHASMDRLHAYVQYYLGSVEKIEILPYHRLGLGKYDTLGVENPLGDVPEMDPQKAMAFQTYVNGLLTHPSRKVV